jgi:hypothetical protein
MTDPHLFLAENGTGHHVLFWGEGPDDRHCVELDLALERMPIAPRKALWDVILGSHLVEDCTSRVTA